MTLNYNVRPSVKFIQENILLIAVAFVSGAMLLWPYVRRVGGGPSVNATQATQLMNREDALVLDVRDPGEYGSGHIIGAKNVPLSRIESAGSEIAAKRREKPVIVYCENGNRATKAVAALKTQGFSRVVNLSGGIAAWQQAGLPLEK
jgi:rhodanese-related sulfurtransferase